MSNQPFIAISEFFKYLTTLPWWAGLIIICCVTIIIVTKNLWKNFFSWLNIKISFASTTIMEYRLFSYLINIALNIVIKDVFRTIFKENHFDQLSGTEFSVYVKDKHKRIMAILKKYVIDFFPVNAKLKVSMKDILDYIDKKSSDYEDMFFDIFTEARKIKKQSIDLFNEIDNEFINEITQITQNNHSENCQQCLLLMFSKREIAENKKEKIKPLKESMNILEQKLIEIQSDLMTFYSGKLNSKK